MTNEEAIKTIKHGCIYRDKRGGEALEVAVNALDLINRLQAQNKDLAETVHNLTLEKDALFDKTEELKAEIERLNGK